MFQTPLVMGQSICTPIAHCLMIWEGAGLALQPALTSDHPPPFQICAIIGGTFTVAGILDSCIFTASEAWKKIQLGKMH